MSALDKPIIAVDLDGVLCPNQTWNGIHDIPDPFPEAAGFLTRLRETFHVTIHTVRTNQYVCGHEGATAELMCVVHRWLLKHNLPYDSLALGKPLAVAYIDDKAILCRPENYGAAGEYGDVLRAAHVMYEENPWCEKQFAVAGKSVLERGYFGA